MKKLRERLLQEMQFRNYSPRTIATYLSCLTRLSKHYKESPDKIDLEKVKTFLHYSVINGCSVSFVNQTISAVRLLHEGVLQTKWEPLSIKRPRKEKKLPVILSQQEVKSIVTILSNLKHKSILNLGYSGGLRIGEVINLKVDHIDSKRMQIRIVGGKGKKDRYTVLSHSTLNLLRDYYKVYQPKDWLFYGYNAGKQYSTSSINKVLARACNKANISKTVTYHTLRHCFATHLLEQGTSIQIIQQLLGHAHISTTTMYLHVQQYKLDQVISPMDIAL
jgi:integrase/recombinase XerD